MIKWNDILDEYYNFYENCLNYFQFKVERFTEENQTVNFCRAIQAKHSNANVWYEYPWTDKNKKACRNDAVIYLPDEEAVLIVESKCLRGCESKYKAMYEDLERILQEDAPKLKTGKIEKVYVIILADYWYKKGKRYFKNIQAAWGDEKYQISEIGEKDNWYTKFIESSKKTNECHWYKYKLQENYWLLSMIAER